MNPSSSRSARRLAAAALAVALPLGAVAAACGSDGPSTDGGADTTLAETTTTVVNTTSLDAVSVTDALDQEPTVSFDPSYVGTEASARTIVEGTGEPLADGQRVSVDYVLVSGADGTVTDTSWDASAETLILDQDQLLPGIYENLLGVPVGSRELIAAEAGDGSGTWLLFVFDVRSAQTIPTEASGEPVTPPEGLPTVTFTDGTPSVTMPGTDPPADLVVQPLIKGAGPEVAAGQTVTLQYAGYLWSSGEQFDSSWDGTGPVDFPIGQGQVISGFDDGLVGQTVGSRVLIVVPPDQGYGDEGNAAAGIDGGATLVFVVDVLAAS